MERGSTTTRFALEGGGLHLKAPPVSEPPGVLDTSTGRVYAVACAVRPFYLTPLAGLLHVKSCRQLGRNNRRRIDGAAVSPARLNPNRRFGVNAGFPLDPGYSYV